MCSATGALTIASRRGSPLRLTRALCPVAMAPPGAESRSVKPRRRRGSTSASVSSSDAGDLELGRQPLAVVGGRRGQGRLGEVHRPAPTGGRPVNARPLPHRREQVDEAGINHQPLAVDHLGVEGDRRLLAGPTASITPPRTTTVPGS